MTLDYVKRAIFTNVLALPIEKKLSSLMQINLPSIGAEFLYKGVKMRAK